MVARLRLALIACLLLGSVGVAAAEVGLIGYTHLLYLTAENLLAVGVVIAVVLALTLKRSDEPLPHVMHPIVVSALVGALSVASSAAFTLIYGGEFVPYELIIALCMGAATAGLSYTLLVDVGERRGRERGVPLYLYLGLALLLLVAGVLRLLAPGSPALTFVFAPVLYFLLPGFALTFALLPDDARLLDHAVYAAPISIGAQSIAVAWFVWLGIALSPLLFYITASVIILVGFVIALVRQRKLLSP